MPNLSHWLGIIHDGMDLTLFRQCLQAIGDGRVLRFAWRIESFVAFKDIMETRKIFSRFFVVDGCRLRLGVYESFDTLCIYLESDALGAGPDRNYWVKYRIAALNQKHYDKTDWKESSICTKSWNNSVLQLMKVRACRCPCCMPFH